MKISVENEYFETLKPLLYVLKIFGILPFILNNRDTCHEKFVTSMMNLSSMIIYSIASGSSIMFIGHNILTLLKHFNFVHFVRITTEITLRIYVLMVPFAMWNKSCLFNEYYDQWKSLQNDLEIMTGTQYKCPIKKRIRWIVCFLLSLLIIMSITYYYVGRMISVTHRISMVLVVSISNFTLGYWYGNCIFTRHVIQVIHKNIEKTVYEESNNKKLQKLVDMWIHVCDLIDRFNSIHSIIFLAQTVLGITNGISNFYSAVFASSSHRKDNLIAGELLSFVIGLSITYMYCESANTLYKQLVHRIQMMLLRKNTSQLPTNYLKTMRFFLNTIEARDPKIELNKVVKIDRSTFIVMMGAGINYLIILTQFGTLYEGRMEKNPF